MPLSHFLYPLQLFILCYYEQKHKFLFYIEKNELEGKRINKIVKMKKRKHRKENGVNHRTKKNQNESVQNKSQQTEKEFFFIFHIK